MTTGTRPRATWARSLRYGGDYNPEQWPRDVWAQDVQLMQEAGVNLVTVGVFSWSTYEPRPGARELDWLEDVCDLLGDAGIGVDLATPTASPPPWLGVLHPETLPVDADGVRLSPGSRNQFSPASRVYRAHALAITQDVVARMARHEAVEMWHVGNEFGQVCHGEESAAAFRAWLAARYNDIGTLNDAWGTAVWSQGYASFDEIAPPRRAPYHLNPAQELDWRRYASDQLRSLFREQKALIQKHDTMRPVTTNFMGFFPGIDPWSWADDVDLVADDAYPDPADPQAAADAALTGDLVRGLGRGAPWLLMESATSAVSWREHNLPKTPARSRRDALQAVAHGADGVLFFQWRAARTGAERFHSAMLPHAGADTRLHAGVRRLGADLARLDAVVGERVPAHVALVVDWPSRWAASTVARPTARLDEHERLRAWHAALWRRSYATDVVAQDGGLDGYDLVLVPQLHLLTQAGADALRRALARGATVVVGPFTGVVDPTTAVHGGPSPALLRDLLGGGAEEWVPLPDGGVALTPGPAWPGGPAPRAHTFGELVSVDGAEVLATVTEGHLAGAPALLRRPVGPGTLWYHAVVLDDDALAATLLAAADAAGVEPVVADVPDGVEAVRRGPVTFLLNHADSPRAHALAAPAHDLLSGHDLDGEILLAPDDVLALVEHPHPSERTDHTS
ncbi:beta-galactosidase [Flavimobilis sp. GY10621]|uniref:Beta-galactosidase n=1 Tax=Flavimobilis rhizosphaerae TaxID=2775421 RepID=A0ABR9DNJ1_9MICO|nr:beta-galactosidase [Flavimobilis rhizosphaerae]MBD9698489.1 beta-galactosidase [Flavimobilis rhizosphaerae]